MKIPAIREFREIYDESGITLILSDYFKRMMLSVILVFVLTSISTGLIYSFIYHLSLLRLILVVFSMSLVFTNFAALLFLYYPLYRRNQVRSKIENSLLHTLSYMTILSSGGSGIERIMERVSEVEETFYIKQLAKKFIIDIRLLGFDVITALEDIINRTPLKNLKKMLSSINHNIKTSGDIKELLSHEVERQFQIKRDGLKRTMGSLTYLGEIYVALLVVGPILFILMITILSVFSGGGASILQLNLIVFFGLPVMAIGFIIMLDTVVRGDE